MDPSAALNIIRERMADVLASETDDGFTDGDAIATLVEYLQGLDEWLSRGGFLPRDWTTA